MAELVCVAERVFFGGIILRWYPSTIHYSRRWCYASAREGGVRHHAYVHEIPLAVQAAAADAYDLMQSGQWAAVEAMATYRPVWSWWLVARRLEPILRPGLVCDGVPGRDLDQPWAVCGRVDRHGEHPLGGGRG